MIAKIGIEGRAVQYPLVHYAAQVGWKYVKIEATMLMRGGESGVLLQENFLIKVQRLNPGVVEHSRPVIRLDE